MSDDDDRRFMRRALALGARGVGRASPNPAVGCVIVSGGAIVGRGWHDYARVDHAESVALAAAGARARGATAYVTLEPCSHAGRTPPCAEALIRAGLHSVVVGAVDPNPRVRGRGIDRLRRAGIEVRVGVCEPQARRLVEPFACHMETGRPLVVGKVAMSLDGRIATASGESRWITGQAARRYGQRLRRELDAILVGIGTVLADDPELTDRGRLPRGRPLTRVILDSRLRTPVGARALRGAPRIPVLIFCRPDAPMARRRRLEAAGAEPVVVPGATAGVDLDAVVAELGRRSILGLLVEGGSAVHGAFVDRELVDKLCLVVAPVLIGGAKALPAFGGRGVTSLAGAPRFTIARRFSIGPDQIVEAYPPYSRSIAAPPRLRAVPPSGARGSAPASRPR